MDWFIPHGLLRSNFYLSGGPQTFIGSALARFGLLPTRIWGIQENWGVGVDLAEHFTNIPDLKEGFGVFGVSAPPREAPHYQASPTLPAMSQALGF